ncbi:MAG: XdhC family protein, partial [Chloroflexi bacterium]
MKDVMNDMNRWLAENTAVSLATVVQTWGSAPRRVGAKMAVTADGRFCGSVSGGCVEGAVIEASQQILASGQARLLRYGVADETAWDVGLACGGSIEIFVQPLDTAVYHFLHAAIQSEQAATAMTIIEGTASQKGRTMAFDEAGGQAGTLGSPALDAQAREAAAAIRQPTKLPLADDLVLFVDPIRPSPRLVMVG